MTAKKKLTINILAEVLSSLDKVRGDTPRSVFVQRAIEKYLKVIEGGIRRAKK